MEGTQQLLVVAIRRTKLITRSGQPIDYFSFIQLGATKNSSPLKIVPVEFDRILNQ